MEVYKAVNKVNGKIYIGQTTLDTETRKNGHFREARSSKKTNTRFHNAINKYGEDNFEFSCIDTADTLQELNAKEIYWIAYYNSTDREVGYNIEIGGRNSEMAESTKRKIGEETKKDWQNPETAKRMAKGLEKATKRWQQICKENRIRVECKKCGKVIYLAPYLAKGRAYCSIECSSTDRVKDLVAHARQAEKERQEEYSKQARAITDEWVTNGGDDYKELVSILKTHFNVKDHRTVIRYVTQDKGTYQQLKEYLKTVRS